MEINGNTLTVHKYGEEVAITATQNGKEEYINSASAIKTITTKIGTIQFDNNESKGDKHWNDPNNWLPVSELNKQRNVEPSTDGNATLIYADGTPRATVEMY